MFTPKSNVRGFVHRSRFVSSIWILAIKMEAGSPIHLHQVYLIRWKNQIQTWRSTTARSTVDCMIVQGGHASACLLPSVEQSTWSYLRQSDRNMDIGVACVCLRWPISELPMLEELIPNRKGGLDYQTSRNCWHNKGTYPIIPYINLGLRLMNQGVLKTPVWHRRFGPRSSRLISHWDSMSASLVCCLQQFSQVHFYTLPRSQRSCTNLSPRKRQIPVDRPFRMLDTNCEPGPSARGRHWNWLSTGGSGLQTRWLSHGQPTSPDCSSIVSENLLLVISIANLSGRKVLETLKMSMRHGRNRSPFQIMTNRFAPATAKHGSTAPRMHRDTTSLTKPEGLLFHVETTHARDHIELFHARRSVMNMSESSMVQWLLSFDG